MKIGIIGSGAMGSGIAQVAAQAGHQVKLTDLNVDVLKSSEAKLAKVMNRLVKKGKFTSNEATEIQKRINRSTNLKDLKDCNLIVEAVIEKIEVKKTVFSQLEEIVSDDTILASNTSSLSITSIAKNCRFSDRVVGLHFFNPAPLMPLVEIIPALQTKVGITDMLLKLMKDWGKTPVVAKDTPVLL